MFTIPDKGEGLNNIQSILFQEYIDILVAGISGRDAVVSGCAVTADTGMQLNVAAGVVKSDGIEYAVSSATPAISAAHSTHPRLDLVVVNSSGTVAVRTGAHSASPHPAAKSVNDVVLAVVYVPATLTTVLNDHIVDLRVLGAQEILVSGTNIRTINGASVLGSGNILVGETTGAVAAFAMNSVPSGWLAANGAAVSRTTYAALFAAIGTTYGAGDGSTTFALPDLRGYFARGSGTNSDGTASGTFGAKQADELKAHAHNLSIALKPPSDFSTTYPSHSSNNGDGASVTATSTGGTETRPKNIAMLYCIKY